MNPEEGVSKVFDMLDTDKDGLISGEDLKRGISMFGSSVSETDIDEMLASADVDGDGMINYEEFLKVMVSFNFIINKLGIFIYFSLYNRHLRKSMANHNFNFRLYLLIKKKIMHFDTHRALVVYHNSHTCTLLSITL